MYFVDDALDRLLGSGVPGAAGFDEQGDEFISEEQEPILDLISDLVIEIVNDISDSRILGP